MKLGAIIRKDFLQLFFVILSFSLMVLVSYHYVSGIVEEQIFSNAEESLNTAEVAIRSDLREAEVALFHTGLLIENFLEENRSIEDIKAYLSLITQSFSGEASIIPGLVDVYGYIHESYISGIDWDPPDSYIPQHLSWYRAAREANDGIGFTVPYINEATGKLVISLTETLHGSRNEDHGIIAIDLDFSKLSGYITSLHSAEGGYGMLTSSSGIFLVHPFVENIGRSVIDVIPGYDRNSRQFLNDSDSMTIQKTLNRDGVQMVIIFKRLYNNWHLGIAIPVSSYYRNVEHMALALSGLGIVFMIILSFILIQLSLSKARSEEENLEKSSFLARMSHEIRTPMNSILGMAELIQRKTVSADIQEYIEIIYQSGNNLLAIINDILDFSKIESGRLQIENHEYHMASVINDMINMIRPRVAEKSLDIFVNVSSGIPGQLFGDDMRLRQIMTNLLSNAVKYTRKGFISMDVEMEHVNDSSLRLIITVRDSGIGIKLEDQKKLFSEFARMDSKANLGIEGTGLGLAITRALCRAMGGDVTVESEYSRGSEFRATIIQDWVNDKPVAHVYNPEKKEVLFYDWRPQYVQSISLTLLSLGVSFKCPDVFQDFLSDLEYGSYDYAFISSKYAMDCISALGRRDSPLQLVIMVEPGEVAVYREVPSILMPVYSITMANILNNVTEGTLSKDKNLKIQFTAPSAMVLIVDDISTNLRVAKELMSPYKMNVHTCLSGSESLTMVEENRYDLVFMDHMMPGMDGIEATSFIRNLESGDGYYQNLPIIALTANAISGQREMFLENGINDFLAKPIDIQKLNDILERWLPADKRVEFTASSHPGIKQDRPSGVLNIPGVNTTLGLNNCGGARAVYLNILIDFCKDAEARLSQISDTMEKKDTKLYTTLVHALKGAARSIGAVETGEKASWLEKAAAREDLAAIKDKTFDLQENVRALINNIKATVEQLEAEDSRELSDISSLHLTELTKALSDMDIEAVNKMLVDYASLALDTKTKELIGEVEQLVLMFEYDKAIEKIKELFF